VSCSFVRRKAAKSLEETYAHEAEEAEKAAKEIGLNTDGKNSKESEVCLVTCCCTFFVCLIGRLFVSKGLVESFDFEETRKINFLGRYGSQIFQTLKKEEGRHH
jgi:hypothetical protein